MMTGVRSTGDQLLIEEGVPIPYLFGSVQNLALFTRVDSSITFRFPALHDSWSPRYRCRRRVMSLVFSTGPVSGIDHLMHFLAEDAATGKPVFVVASADDIAVYGVVEIQRKASQKYDAGRFDRSRVIVTKADFEQAAPS
jgi:hypothetical protein